MKTRLPTFDSMAAAAGACGIPIATLRRAKKAGCAAFAHGRVSLAEFLKWNFSRADSTPGPSLEQAKARLATVRANQIAQESAVAGGALPSGWAVATVGEVFEDGRLLFLNDRVEALVRRIWNGAQDTDRSKAEMEIEYQLREDTETLLRVLRHLRTALEAKLRAGPDGAVETDCAMAARILREMAAKLTPSAKAELLAVIDTFPAVPPEAVEDQQTTSGNDNEDPKL
jgi:hypothetical protein